MDKNHQTLVPPRRTYYDMNPWYEHLKKVGEFDWQQVDKNADLFLWSILKNHVRKKLNFKVLDVGCGGGGFALSLLQKNLEIHAFDFSEIAIEMAKSKPQSNALHFFNGNALDRDAYSSGPYNIIIAKDFLHGLFDLDRLRFLQLAKSALDSNGYLFLTTQIGLPLDNPEKLKNIDLVTRKNKIQTQIYLEKEQIDQELLLAGFDIKVFHPMNSQFGCYILS